MLTVIPTDSQFGKCAIHGRPACRTALSVLPSILVASANTSSHLKCSTENTVKPMRSGAAVCYVLARKVYPSTTGMPNSKLASSKCRLSAPQFPALTTQRTQGPWKAWKARVYSVIGHARCIQRWWPIFQMPTKCLVFSYNAPGRLSGQ